MSPRRLAALLAGVTLALVLSVAAKARDDYPTWRLIGKFGIVRTVYVSRPGLKDRTFMAQVLQGVVNEAPGPGGAVMIMIFDDPRFTPRAFPMTDAQMRHLRAQYNRNPRSGLDKFVWIKITNPKASPPELREIPDPKIRPGFAED